VPLLLLPPPPPPLPLLLLVVLLLLPPPLWLLWLLWLRASDRKRSTTSSDRTAPTFVTTADTFQLPLLTTGSPLPVPVCCPATFKATAVTDVYAKRLYESPAPNSNKAGT
jgi:hypothetical protein